ncbi:MAG: Fe-S protein assembly co-chaperone HscB [Pseudomonadales bacterium]
MSLTENYFQLFDLEEQYCLDENALRATYRELQRKTHPDKFAEAGKHEQMLAVQYAATINDAYDVLTSPLKRAIYMLQLRGVELDEQGSGLMDPAFLMEQMELREELEQASHANNPEAALEKVTEHLDTELDALQADFKAQIERDDTEAAVETVKKMQFLVKLETEVEHLAHELLSD